MKFTEKKILFIVAWSLLLTAEAQSTSLGIGAGLLNGSERAVRAGNSASASDTGFYVGILSDYTISEKFKIKAELDYGNLGDTSFGFLSVQGKYYPIQKLYVQVGPQLSHIFNQLGSTLKDTGFDLSLGAGFDVTDNFTVQARYAINLTNRNNTGFDQTSKLRWLFVGVGYSFDL